LKSISAAADDAGSRSRSPTVKEGSAIARPNQREKILSSEIFLPQPFASRCFQFIRPIKSDQLKFVEHNLAVEQFPF
jgi:hypothetical protein